MAREMMRNGKEDRAKLILRKKKFQEKLIASARDKVVNLEQLVNSIEFAKVQGQVIAAMKTGKDELERLNNQMKMEDIEKLVEDTKDAVAYQFEVSKLVGAELTAEDDQDVLAELERIELENKNESQREVLPEMPSVQRTTKAAVEAEIDQHRQQEDLVPPALLS